MPPFDDLEYGATLRGLAPGQRMFGRFELVRILGRGGMGVVWLARDTQLEEDVALKFLPDELLGDAGAMEELKRETRRGRSLTHQNIVKIHDFFLEGRVAGISMEYVDGDTLSNLRYQEDRRCFEVAEIREWMRQICEALSYAHEDAKVAHRDLKPANLMVTRGGKAKVTDFGISSSIQESASRVTARPTSGTLVYMSPQQLMGEAPSVSDDVYALGATLYDLLTGKPPFYTGNVDLQIREKVPMRMSARREQLEIRGMQSIPEEWEATVAACLAKEAAQRPKSVREVASRLGLNGSTLEGTSRGVKAEVGKSGPLWGKAALVALLAALWVELPWGMEERSPKLKEARPGTHYWPGVGGSRSEDVAAEAETRRLTEAATRKAEEQERSRLAAQRKAAEGTSARQEALETRSTGSLGARIPKEGAGGNGEVSASIALINMKKVFDELPQTKTSEEEINKNRVLMRKELDRRMEFFDKLQAEAKRLQAEAGRTDLSKTLKNTAARNLNEKLQLLEEMQREITEWQANQEKELEKQSVKARNIIVNEMNIVIASAFKKAGGDIFLDSSAQSLDSMPFLVWVDGIPDLSSSIIARLKNAASPEKLQVQNRFKVASIDLSRVLNALPITKTAEAEAAAARAKINSQTKSEKELKEAEEKIKKGEVEKRNLAFSRVKVVTDSLGKSKRYNLILNKSGQSLNALPLVSVSGTVPDLTNEVLAELKALE